MLLGRCCDHDPGEACECAEQVAADVDALIGSGLLRTDHCPNQLGGGDPMTPVLADDREFRTELVWAPAAGNGWSEQPGWTLYVDGVPVANTAADLLPEAAQRWASAQLGEGVVWLAGHGRWYFVANPRQSGDAPR